MQYHVVFDAANADLSSWSLPLMGLPFTVLGIIQIKFLHLIPGWWRKHPRLSKYYAWIFFSIALLWTAMTALSTYQDHANIRSAASSGKIKVIEGVVTHFSPMPPGGHAIEKFCVQEKSFEYSDFIDTAGFHNTRAYGGPVREGLPVRVTYVDDEIIKLEIGN